MTNRTEDLEMERKLAEYRFRQEQEAAAKPGLADRIRAAKAKAEYMAAHPTDTAEQALRFGVRTVASGALRGSRAVLQGLDDSRKEAMGETRPVIDAQATVANAPPSSVPADALDWFQQRYARLDAKIGEVADSHKSLTWHASVYLTRKTWRILEWSAETYPAILKLCVMAANRLKPGLERKIVASGGPGSGLQRLRLKIYKGIGPRKNPLAAFRYAAINLASVAGVLLGGADIAYNYHVHEYHSVHVGKINAQSSDTMFEYRIDGYKVQKNGDHHPLNFDIKHSWWHPSYYPRTVATQLEEHQICDIKAYGIPAILPNRLRILAGPANALRQWLNDYPIILDARCRPDPDWQRTGQLTPLRGPATGSLVAPLQFAAN